MPQDYITHLKLEPHEEGGHFKVMYSSDQMINVSNEDPKPAGSAIYYHLSKDEFSTFHKLTFDETWHFYAGSPVILSIINNDGTLSQRKLGNPMLNEGAVFQTTVQKNVWFAAELEDKTSFALVGCSCSPGYSEGSEELGNVNELVELYPQHEALIRRLTK